MKRWIAGVGVILLSATLLPGDLVMVQRMEECGRSMEITVKVKGELIRTDVSGEISTITNTASGETVTLRHAQKTCLRMSADATQDLMKQLEQLREENQKAGITQNPFKLEPTGKHENVAGQETRIYTTQVGSIRVTYWIADKYPNADKYLEVFRHLQKSAMTTLARGMTNIPGEFEFPGIPVKTEMATPDGRKISTTILSIKEEPLEDIDFTIPPDYLLRPKPLFEQSPPSLTP